MISNFRHVLNVVCFLLNNSPASEFYMPTFGKEMVFTISLVVGYVCDDIRGKFKSKAGLIVQVH